MKYLIIFLFCFLDTFLLYSKGKTIDGNGNANDWVKQASNFTFTYSMTKQEYIQLEPVILIITIKNEGESADSLNIMDFSDFLPWLKVSNEQGKVLPYCSGIGDHFSYYVKLSPGQETSYAGEISIGYGDIAIGYDFHPSRYFSQGNYSIKNYSIYGKRGVDGTKFSILLPPESELNTFEDIIKLSNSNPQIPLNEQYEDLLNKYPSSLYTEEIFYSFSSTLHTIPKMLGESYINDCRWFFDNYANSYYVDHILKYSSEVLSAIRKNPKDAVNDFLNEMIDKHPNTKVKERAEYYLSTGQFTK